MSENNNLTKVIKKLQGINRRKILIIQKYSEDKVVLQIKMKQLNLMEGLIGFQAQDITILQNIIANKQALFCHCSNNLGGFE